MTNRPPRSRKRQKSHFNTQMCRGRHEVEASERQERSRPAAEIKKHKATIGNHDQKKSEQMQT
jgi:hypothetical protein